MTKILPLKKRHYQCKECEHEVEIETNHEIECYPFCKGACYQSLPNENGLKMTGRRLPVQTTHIFVGQK